MNMLHLMRNSDRTLHEVLKLSPLKAWLVRHGHSSIVKFAQLEVSDFQAPLVFQVRLFYKSIIVRLLITSNSTLMYTQLCQWLTLIKYNLSMTPGRDPHEAVRGVY